jgi:hypothetical protein
MWRKGEVDQAASLGNWMKRFALFAENDPYSRGLMKLNQAALTNENLANTLQDVLKNVEQEVSEEDLPEAHRGLAATLVSYGRLGIVDDLLDKSAHSEFKGVWRTTLATHFA